MKITKTGSAEATPKVPKFKVGDVLVVTGCSGAEYVHLVTDVCGKIFLADLKKAGHYWTAPSTMPELVNDLNGGQVMSVKVYSADNVELILKEEN